MAKQSSSEAEAVVVAQLALAPWKALVFPGAELPVAASGCIVTDSSTVGLAPDVMLIMTG